MRKTATQPFTIVGTTLIAVGAAFAAVGASGQAAFGYTAAGLLLPGLVLLVLGVRAGRR
ncbi:hypothetical protein [Pseudomonas sp. NPDC089406]|uniref:hypothetical protein n=1 Tax=Pseudomonas sp. NPDC089406 TaxID=3364463 RepID=UPI00384EC981